MAYVADFTTKSNAAKATTLVFAATDFPDHVIDDYLVLGITCEAEVAVTFSTTAGWTQIGATVGNPATATGMYSAMWYKKCASTAETCTITLSVTNASHGHAFLISDADPTTFLDGTPSAVNVATATTFSSATITTTQPDSLLLYYVGVDSTTTTPTACHTDPGPVHFIDSSDNGGANVTSNSKVMASASAGWYIQRTAGVTPAPVWKNSLTAMTNRFTVGIRNKPSGQIPAYIDDVNPLGSQLMQGTYFGTTAYNGESFPSTLTLTQLTGTPAVATLYDAGALAADGGLNPYSAGINSSPSISATTVAGFQVIHTSTDMTTGWIVGAVKGSTSKMALYNQGNIKKGGMYMVVGSGTTTANNYRSFQILGRDNQDGNAVDFSVFSVQPNQTQTQFGVAGAAVPDIAAMTRIGLFQRAMQGSGTTSFIFPEIQFIKKVTVAGGDATFPVAALGVSEVGKSSRIPLIKKIGANELMAYVPLQIGGGDAVNFQIDAGALQFPRIYSQAEKEVNYHGSDNSIGISYAGKLGDVIKHTNSVITSASPYFWEINAAATSAATWDFSGLVVVKATVTLRPVMTFDSMAFSGCASVATTGSTVTNCTFGNSPISVSSPANAALISSCKITKTAGTSHGITIAGAVANITLSGVVFTGYAASNGSTGNEAIFVNIATGNMTISIAGGSTPSIRTAGAVVTVVSGATVTFVGLPIGTDIVVLTANTTTILQQIDANATTSYAWGYSGTPTVDVGFIKTGYVPYYIRNLSLTATDSSIPVAMSTDRNYI